EVRRLASEPSADASAFIGTDGWSASGIVLPQPHPDEQPNSLFSNSCRRYVSILDDRRDYAAEQVEGIENVLGPKAGLSVCGRGTLVVKFRFASLKGVSFLAWWFKVKGVEIGNTKLQFSLLKVKSALPEITPPTNRLATAQLLDGACSLRS